MDSSTDINLKAQPPMPQSLTLDNIRFRYRQDENQTLNIDDLTITSGESVALIGPTGVGKSTLLKLIDGRLSGWHGQLRVLGRTVIASRRPDRFHARSIGFIFQEFALVERQTVFENVRNGRLGHMSTVRSIFGILNQDDAKHIHGAISDTGLETLTNRRVDTLSGGQRQRVAIARCLAQEPGMILADEPISNQDPDRARETVRLLSELCRKNNATLIITTHQPDLVRPFVDRIITLASGSIALDEQTSHREEPDDPANGPEHHSRKHQSSQAEPDND